MGSAAVSAVSVAVRTEIAGSSVHRQFQWTLVWSGLVNVHSGFQHLAHVCTHTGYSGLAAGFGGSCTSLSTS